jgi:hypothetical protein
LIPSKALTIDALVPKIYAIRTESEKKACRASLTAALHRMEKSDTSLIERIDTGLYRFRAQVKKDFGVARDVQGIIGMNNPQKQTAARPPPNCCCCSFN